MPSRPNFSAVSDCFLRISGGLPGPKNSTQSGISSGVGVWHNPSDICSDERQRGTRTSIFHGISFGIVCLIFLSQAMPAQNTGIIQSIVKAPVVPDGDVARALTDVVINLDTSLDPSVPGRTFLTGKKIRIFLPAGFVDAGLPTATLFTPGCVPGSLATLTCNTVSLLQGFPQHPLGFPPPTIPTKYQVYSGGQNVIVVEALQDLIPNPPLEPGLKQLHLLLFGFVNPNPGQYVIRIESETGPGGALETGSGAVIIQPRPRPSINVTGAVNPGAPNTIYQEAATGQLTPLPYDFLLWDQNGLPMVGVEISKGLLVQEGRAVGQVSIEAPAGATGQEIYSTAPSYLISAPVTAVPTGRLNVQFRVGSIPGEYVARFRMAGGNETAMFVHVVQ